MFKGFKISPQTALLILMSAILGGLLTFAIFDLFSPEPIQPPDKSKTNDKSEAVWLWQLILERRIDG